MAVYSSVATVQQEEIAQVGKRIVATASQFSPQIPTQVWCRAWT